MLIVDFWVSLDADDDQRIALRLKDEMKDALNDHPNIRIEYWKDPIIAEDGRDLAIQLAQDPTIDANFVIWGYRVPRRNVWDVEQVYVRFEMVKQKLPFFGRTYDQAYGPSHILQPSMFEFKTDLSDQWTDFVAFATGLTHYQANNYVDANPFFETAAQLLHPQEPLPTDPEVARTIYFYRGSNYLYLDRGDLACPTSMHSMNSCPQTRLNSLKMNLACIPWAIWEMRTCF
ncbi:MAG: hypothetical protein AAF639_07110 [Chloroflexota bacterium]